MSTPRIKQLFTECAQKVLEQTGHELPTGPLNGPLLIRGGLLLEGELATVYLKTRDQIMRVLETKPAWSESTVDNLLAEHLYRTCTSPKKGKEAIADEALSFVSKFNESPAEWNIGLAVFGLGFDCAHVSFGKLTFETDTFTPHTSLDHRLEKGRPTQDLYAQITIQAVDQPTALFRAEEKVDQHLALLNALCADGRPSMTCVSRALHGTYIGLGVSRFSCAALEESGHIVHKILKTRLLKRSDLDDKLRSGVGVGVDRHLKSSSELGDRLLAAYGFFGKAELEPQRHSAFLFYAVALESAILPKKAPDISQQLALRTAHLLFNSVSGRKDMYKRLKDLYDLRSRIVHSASTEVLDSQLADLRKITLISFDILFSHNEFIGMTMLKDLDDWFLERLLDSKVDL